MSVEGECRRKVRYGKRKDAVERGRELGMRAYGCRWCGGYHLTSDIHGASTPQARMPKPRRLLPAQKEKAR